MCVRIDSVIKSDNALAAVGGPNGESAEFGRWLLGVDEVIDLIDDTDQQWVFVVEEPAGDRVLVRTKTAQDGSRYLTTVPDAFPSAQNNLANLPAPPGDQEFAPVRFPAWLPHPRAPRMQRFGTASSQIQPDGSIFVDPTPAVGFTVVAPWPGNLRFTCRRRMGGTINLEVELTTAGQHVAEYSWVDYTPLEPDFEKRDATVWWVQLRLPPPATGIWTSSAETFEIEIRHQTVNPLCQERLSDPLRFTLRLLPGAGPIVGSSPPASPPKNGVVDLDLSSVGENRPGYPTRFVLDARNDVRVPEDAVISSVQNVSKTALITDGATRARKPLGGLRFSRDGTSNVTLGANEATSMFNGQWVQGSWAADYVGGSVAFLFENPGTLSPRLDPSIKLRVSWLRP